MIGALTAPGITILSTVEVEDNFTSLQFSHYAISFSPTTLSVCVMLRSTANFER